MKCEGPRQRPSDEDHVPTPPHSPGLYGQYGWVGWFQLVFCDLGLGFCDVVHKAKRLKTGELVPNTNSTISGCVITGKPLKSSEPQFLSSTYLPIHPSIHPSIFYLRPSQQVVVKRKKGSIKRETLWKLQMHKFIAIVQMMIDGQGLRT